MANNRIILKRTNTSGRTPNTTASYATNSQYISAGELALNMADGILYTSNGSTLIEVGANNTNVRITGNVALTTNNRRISFTPLAGGSNVFFVQQNDDNFVFYSTNTVNGERPIWSIFANSVTSDFQIQVPLRLNSSLIANGGLGSAGQVLTSNGSGTYWSSAGSGTGTVTSVGSGNGLTGGPITSSGSLSVLANTGIVANATGVFVNAAYINTISSNSATFANSSVTNTFTVGTASYFVANGNFGIGSSSPAQKLQVNGSQYMSGGNATAISWAADLSSHYIRYNTSLNGLQMQGFGALAFLTGGENERMRIASDGFVGIGTSSPSATLHVGDTVVAADRTVRVTNSNMPVGFDMLVSSGGPGGYLWVRDNSFMSLGTNNAERVRITNTGNVGIGTTSPGTRLDVRRTDSQTGYAELVTFAQQVDATNNSILSFGQISDNRMFIEARDESNNKGILSLQPYGGSVTVSGVTTFSANIILGSSGLSANGGFGTAGHTLHSNGSATYWAADDQGVTSVATGNGLTGGTITSTGTVSVLANTGIVANATGTYVNATYIGTLSANNTTFLNSLSSNNYTQRYSIPNTLASPGWIRLGTMSTSQDGRHIIIRIVAGAGYNAQIAQNAETVIRFKTSNGGSNTAGFFGDGYAYRSGNITAPSTIRVVQLSTTSYEFWGNFAAYTGEGAFYEVACNGSTWTHSGTNNGATAPTGTTTDLTIYTPIHSGLANTGIIANSTGIYVNSAYINTISSNSATFLGVSGNFGNATGIYTSGVVNAVSFTTTNFSANSSTVTTPNVILIGDAVNGYGRLVTASNSFYIQAGNNTGTGNSSPIIFTNINAGSEWMRITANGHVGIGNTAPFGRLTVQKAAGQSVGGELYLTDSVYWTQFNSRSSAGAYNPLVQAGDHSIIYTDGAANTGALVIAPWHADARGIRIDANGRVGIGTSPSSALHVAGGSGSTIRNTANAGSSWFVGTNIDSYILHNESNTPMLLTTNGTERMRITADGDVGIGTSSPLSFGGYRWLTINGANTGAITSYSVNNTEYFRVQAETNATFLNALQNIQMVFLTNNTERMRITNAGLVGIGNNNPTQALQVQGSVLTHNGASAANTARNAGIRLWTDLSFGAELHYGSVGSGQSDSWATAIYGRRSDPVAVRIGSYATTNTTAQNTFSEYVTFMNNGNVGIGNTNPGYRLQVSGGEIAQRQTDGSMARISLVNTNRNWTFSNYGTAFAPNGSLNIADETAAAVRFRIDTSGDITAFTSYRAPIFYDSDNTGFYIDPNSQSVISSCVTYAGVFVAGNAVTDDVWTQSLEIREVNRVGNAQTASSYAPSINFHWSNIAACAIKMYSDGHLRIRAQSTTSTDYRNVYMASLFANIFYDNNNTAFYVDPASTSIINNAQITTLGVGTAASGTTGEIRATNNITAYFSDKRLKDIKSTIPNALDKVMSLSGIIYTSNETAAKYGYKDQSEQVGVIAQEVETVLPQIVKSAPFDTKYVEGKEVSISGENYKTVQYEKLIPLLIEAIKEQQGQIESLTNEINNLKGVN